MGRGSIFLMVSRDDTYHSCLLTRFPQVSWAVYSSEEHPRQFGFSFCWISRDDLPHSRLQPVCVQLDRRAFFRSVLNNNSLRPTHIGGRLGNVYSDTVAHYRLQQCFEQRQYQVIDASNSTRW